ncbi:MAG: F0F1 ATP synthase subunit delta [Gammaproteobacteria bacterium]|nr:F0F1 ATP synthase subunit delta [Gammaproteobacteria bacterium]
MAEKRTLARPYAQAAFDWASAAGNMAAWSDALELLSIIASDEKVKALFGNPRVSKEELVSLFCDIAGEQLDDAGRNFVKVLADAARLNVLPEIAAHYERYRSQAERSVEAEITSAFRVTKTQQEKIAKALKARLGCDVSLKCTIDKSLIGGAIIRAGDMVIDGSARGQLGRLATALSH